MTIEVFLYAIRQLRLADRKSKEFADAATKEGASIWVRKGWTNAAQIRDLKYETAKRAAMEFFNLQEK